MADEKVKSETVRLQRAMELHEYALAAFYPLTHSGISAHHKRAADRLPEIAPHPLLSALGGNHLPPPKSIAKASGEAVVAGAVAPPQVERLLRHISEHRYQRPPDEPKPWKKPWDK